MKRGKDDEKIMGPMFPRLHVNDTEKGGPRAPPRNKMALYEQLSIPSSQRFNHGVLPLNPNKAAGVVPPASSSQGIGHEKGTLLPLQLPHLTHHAEKSYAGYSDVNNTQMAQLEQKKKIDEEDFTVPNLAQSEIGGHNKNSNGMEKISRSSPAYLGHSMNVPDTTNEKESKRTSTKGSNLRQEGRSQIKEKPLQVTEVEEQSDKFVKISSATEKFGGPLKHTDGYAGQEHGNHLVNKFDRMQSTGASSHDESRYMLQLHKSMHGNGISNEPVRVVENGRASVLSRDSCPPELGSPNYPTNDSGYHEDNTHRSLQSGNGERGDDASQTSVVDSISGLDISPDDVVGIIGQKHFWKARKAIVNQQRVFAVQVFELHRLIKVQRSIAGSPHLLLEDGAYLGNPLNGSSVKKLPLEYIVKPSPRILKHKDDAENPNPRIECSAENVVGRTSLSSVQTVSHPFSYRSFSGNPLSTPVIADTKSGSCFHQLPGHQWLIPVMSPSEGLIYKPYPGHGFMGPVCGGFGPPGSNPVMGNFINSAYGVPPSHHHYQEIGVPPTPPYGHGFFPSYGMPIINPVMSGLPVEQANNFTGLGSRGQPGQLSGEVATFSMQHQSSCNVPTQKNEGIPNAVELRTNKENELQGSTGSSPGERRVRVGPTNEGINALSLFPTSPAVHIPEGASQLHDTDQPTRVIKVVPRNARSATESAARIFRSIQEERKQYDSV